MGISLITGYAGKPHVTSAQHGAWNAATYGKGKYVLNVGNQFAYEIISNNSIRIKDGYALNQGRFMGMGGGDYEDVTIDNGVQGVKRMDLIVLRYVLNPDTGIETAELTVIKGSSGDEYVEPECVTGDILSGAAEDDLLLYKVKIDGINLVSVEPWFKLSAPAMDVVDFINLTDTRDNTVTFESSDAMTGGWTDIPLLSSGKHSDVFKRISEMFKNIRFLHRFIGDTDISTEGDTITGAINALATKKGTTVNVLTDELGDWEEGEEAGEKTLLSVCYGAGRFVAVGYSGAVYYSTNGYEWTAGVELGTNTFNCVTYGKDKFIAVGGTSETGDNIYYSDDGVTWESTAINGDLRSIVYENGKFLLIGVRGATWYSNDGITWSRTTATNSTATLQSMCYGGGVYVAVSAEGRVDYSMDGENWSAASGIDKGLYGVAYGNGMFVAVGAAAIYTSKDGKTWGKQQTDVTATLNAIAYGNGVFFAAGSNGVSYYSKDGITWKNKGAGTETIYGTTYGAGKFVTVGNAGNIGCINFQKKVQTVESAINTVQEETEDVKAQLNGLMAMAYETAGDINDLKNIIKTGSIHTPTHTTHISTLEILKKIGSKYIAIGVFGVPAYDATNGITFNLLSYETEATTLTVETGSINWMQPEIENNAPVNKWYVQNIPTSISLKRSSPYTKNYSQTITSKINGGAMKGWYFVIFTEDEEEPEEETIILKEEEELEEETVTLKETADEADAGLQPVVGETI